jgi:hypothetical protein
VLQSASKAEAFVLRPVTALVNQSKAE